MLNYLKLSNLPAVQGLSQASHDLSRKVHISYYVTVFFFLISSILSVNFALLEDTVGTIRCSLFSISLLIALVLFRIKQHKFARVVWVLSCNLAIVLALPFANPGEDRDLLFLILIALPFLIFSREKEPYLLYISFFLPVLLWVFCMSFGVVGASMAIFGIPLLPSAIDIDILNRAIQVTVGTSLVVVIGIFAYVTSRTSQDLYLANKKAQLAFKKKHEFLATMSHEIRTPISGIVGMIEVMEILLQSEEQKRAVEIIRNSSFSLLRIIDDILDANQIDRAEFDIQASKTELRSIVEGAVVTLQTMADQNGVRLALCIDPDVPQWTLADPGRLRQIILNVLSNAIKYTADDLIGCTGWVYICLKPSTNGNLILQIEDEGIGMTEDLQNKLFQPFIQGEMTTSRRVDGTGLGLTITKRLVQQMGGEILTTSTVGKGTKVCIFLPLQALSSSPKNTNLKKLNIVYVKGLNQVRLWHFSASLKKMGMTFVEPPLLDNGLPIIDRTKQNQIYCLHSEEDNEIEYWKSHIQKQAENPSFILFSHKRTEKFGRLEPNVIRIQSNPVLHSEMFAALYLLTDSNSSTYTAPVTELDTPQQPEKPQGDIKLLIVEDNAINRIVLLKQLEVLGYAADAAENGEDGLKLWQSGGYNAILTDCNMPIKDGFEMVRDGRLWEEERSKPRLPVIAITANALKGDENECVDAGMDDYLAKPIEIRSLEQKLAKFLQS